jgi:hypothetical protein
MFLPGQQAPGQRFTSIDERPHETVGVVAKTMDDFNGQAEPEIYVPYAQAPWSDGYLVIHADSHLEALTTSAARSERPGSLGVGLQREIDGPAG